VGTMGYAHESVRYLENEKGVVIKQLHSTTKDLRFNLTTDGVAHPAPKRVGEGRAFRGGILNALVDNAFFATSRICAPLAQPRRRSRRGRAGSTVAA
jgi:hypothetical protein